MEYTVIKDFIERVSLKQIKAGEKYACLDPARVEKLKRLGYIVENEEKPKKEDAKEPEKKTAKASTSAKRSVKKKA